MLKKNELLNKQQLERFQKESVRLLNGEPLQYIIGYQRFDGHKFCVNKHVLIPRPETEELVKWIAEDQCSNKVLSILDIGTGSGCIPIALKKKLPNADVITCDISSNALEVAKKNAKAMCVPIQFQELDFLNEESWTKLPSVNVIVSNPPYIPSSEKENLDTNVRDFEPATALFVEDKDRLLFYRKIAMFGLERLNSLAAIYCEIHRDFAKDTIAVFHNNGYSKIELRKDIFGNDRMLKIEK